jgi:hypothetical protein
MTSASDDGLPLPTAFPLGNQAFLQSLFGMTRWRDVHVCAVPGDPRSAPRDAWLGGRAGLWLKHCGRDTNNYFCVSTFHGTRRIENEFEKLWVLGVDDVGTKVAEDKVQHLLGEPTYMVETSPGNFQWGYRLEKPIKHLGVAKMLQHRVRVALTGEEAKDPGMEGVTRYLRLPSGMNRKGLVDARAG